MFPMLENYKLFAPSASPSQQSLCIWVFFFHHLREGSEIRDQLEGHDCLVTCDCMLETASRKRDPY